MKQSDKDEKENKYIRLLLLGKQWRYENSVRQK